MLEDQLCHHSTVLPSVHEECEDVRDAILDDDDALDEGLRVLQRRLHPDRFATSTQEQRDLADAASVRVNGATAVLRDDLRRADYLLLLETGTSVLDDETRTAPPRLMQGCARSARKVPPKIS